MKTKNHKTLKNTIFKATVYLCTLLFFASCSSDDDSDDGSTQTEDYFLTVQENESTLSFNEIVTVSARADESPFYEIRGIDNNGNTIVFTLNGPVSEGTFGTDPVDPITSFSYTQNTPFTVWGANGEVGSGTVTITENNETSVEGTFMFTGVNRADNTARTFTEGSFRAQKL